MSDDAITQLLAQALQAQLAKRPPAPQAAPRPPGPAPGDPGFSIVPAQKSPEPFGPPAPAPTGPKPGDPGFADQFLTPVQPPAPAVPKGAPPRPAPPRPAPPDKRPIDQQIRDANASIESANIAENERRAAVKGGIPFAHLSAKDADALGAAAQASNFSGRAAPAGVFHNPNAGQALIQPQIVPEHEVPLVNPARQQIEQEAIDQEKQGAQNVGEAEGNVAAAKASGQQNVAAEGRNNALDVQGFAAQARVEHELYRRQMDQFSAALANDRINPNQLLDEQPARHITWTLAKFFGGIAQGILHLPTNQVADQIDKQIARSIETQKANHAIQRERLGDMHTLYGLARQQSVDDFSAMQLAHGYGLEAAKAEAQAQADAAGTPLAQAKADEIKAQLTEKQAQRGIAENKWVLAGTTGGGKTVDSKLVFRDPATGEVYAANSEDDKKKLVSSIELATNIQAAAERYQRALDKLGTTEKIAGKVGYDTDAMSEAQAAHIALLDDIRQANQEGGTIREGLRKAGVYEDSIVSPDRLTGNAARQMAVIVDRTKGLKQTAFDTYVPHQVLPQAQPVGTAPKNVPTGQPYQSPPKVTPGSVGFATPHAKGGKTKQQKPYLVGEEGPELVVPNEPGYVMTAHQTAALLGGGPPTAQQRYYMKAMGIDPKSVEGQRLFGGGMANPSGAENGAIGGGLSSMFRANGGCMSCGGAGCARCMGGRMREDGGELGAKLRGGAVPSAEGSMTASVPMSDASTGTTQHLLNVDQNGRAFYKSVDADYGNSSGGGQDGGSEGAGGSGGVKIPSARMTSDTRLTSRRGNSRGSEERSAPAPARPVERKMTNDELSAWADKLGAQKQQEYDRGMAQGPAVQQAIDTERLRSGETQPPSYMSLSQVAPANGDWTMDRSQGMSPAAPFGWGPTQLYARPMTDYNEATGRIDESAREDGGPIDGGELTDEDMSPEDKADQKAAQEHPVVRAVTQAAQASPTVQKVGETTDRAWDRASEYGQQHPLSPEQRAQWQRVLQKRQDIDHAARIQAERIGNAVNGEGYSSETAQRDAQERQRRTVNVIGDAKPQPVPGYGTAQRVTMDQTVRGKAPPSEPQPGAARHLLETREEGGGIRSRRDTRSADFTASPLNTVSALESSPHAISPETEAYMRREGLWTDKTDALLRSRGMYPPSVSRYDPMGPLEKRARGGSMAAMLARRAG